MSSDTILFDINETVLDLTTLKASFSKTFANDGALPLWFSKLLHMSTVCVATSVKSDFASLAGEVLDEIAVIYGVQLSSVQKSQLLAGFASLPAHSDIKPALTQLRAAGFKTVAFSNSSSKLIAQQIQNAGLGELFDEVISVEPTGSFKPDPAVYRFAAKKLHQPIGQLRLVAAHDWDIHGALSAGMSGAFLGRANKPYNQTIYQQPDITAGSMVDLAQLIIDKRK